MRLAMFHGASRPITIEHVEDPEPGPDDLIVKVHRCGICGSDVSMTGHAPYTYAAGPIGHEYAGEVVGAGRNVRNFSPGQRVAVLPGVACGTCPGCLRTGNHVFCHALRRAAARTAGGGFGEYVAIPAAGAIQMPDSLSFADGALVEPMACGLHALRMVGPVQGSKVLVLGAGSMALSIVYWARRLGAGQIVVASRSARRSTIAYAMGADVFHSLETDGSEGLSGIIGDPDVVAECVGKEGFLSKALESVRPQGTVVSMGLCMHAEPVTAAIGSFREARIFFPIGYSRSEFIETVRAFDADVVRPEAMVSDVISLKDLPTTLESMRKGRVASLKVQVDPWS